MLLSSLRSAAQEYKKLSTALRVLAVIVCVFLIHCAASPSMIGTWLEVGKSATLEFKKDGSFSAVDNEGMAVSGKYTRLKDGRVKFEILHGDASVEIVILNVSVSGDELTVASDHPGDVERYRRMRQ